MCSLEQLNFRAALVTVHGGVMRGGLVLAIVSGGPIVAMEVSLKRTGMLTSNPQVRGNRPGKPVQLQEYEIKYLCTKAREIFINQPILLELEAPIKICGTSCHATL